MAVLIAVGLLLAVLPAPAGAAQDVIVTLAPTGATSIPQGAAFEFMASAENVSPDPVVVAIGLELHGGEGSLEFDRWQVAIDPAETAQATRWVIPSQWYAGLGDYRVVAKLGGQSAGTPLSFEVTSPTVLVPSMEDVTAASGLDTVLPLGDCARFASGAAWGDVEGDDDLDLYVPSQGGPAQLWINDGTGHFADEAPDRGVDNGGRIGIGAVFADYDNDDDHDLYVVNHGPNRLYRNDGSGSFVDVASSAGVDDDGHGSSASWGDYDADGFLDLYVVNYKECTGERAQADKLYHSNGGGSFTDVTELLGPDATHGAGFQAAWFDYDVDRDQDLYLVNDFIALIPEPNRLWRNDGPDGDGWTFTDVSEASGADYSINSMGIGIGDYDGDLDLDVAVSNISGNVLARNNGDGTFTDVAAEAWVQRPAQRRGVNAVTWGLDFRDLNLDRLVDLFVVAGSLHDTGRQAHEMFVNAGGGSFLDLSAPSGVAVDSVGRGAAFADYDRDGRMDFYVVNQAGSPVLYRNVTERAGMHWLEVRTRGTTSNRDGCGARLVLTVAGTRLVREVYCGSIGLSSGSDPVVHFGLGSADQVSKLEVLWPSGTRQVLRRLKGDRLLEVIEPA
jgi:hypothetical protein